MTKKVLILAEVRENNLRNVSFEAIAAAKDIAQGGEVVALLIGSTIEHLAPELAFAGADRVVTIEHPHLQSYTSDGFSQAVLAAYEQEKPDALVFGHTSQGKDLSPKVASRLQSGLISDVVRIEVENGTTQFIRPIYSGKAFETVEVAEGLTFVTVRPNNIAALPKDTTKAVNVSSLKVDIQNLRTVVKEIVRKTTSGVDLSEAKVIVSGGRGVKSAEGFDVLQKLADVLGGAVGASRGACDAGYTDYSLQIGQTGKVVTPDLYIACGISGAIQHIAGMSNAKIIVAINKDPEANIFSIADYGIVGDLFEVVPLLTEEFNNLLLSV